MTERKAWPQWQHCPMPMVPLGRRAPRRWLPALVLAAGVLAWHVWLIGSLAPAGMRPGVAAPGRGMPALQVRTLVGRAPAMPAQPAAAAPLPPVLPAPPAVRRATAAPRGGLPVEAPALAPATSPSPADLSTDLSTDLPTDTPIPAPADALPEASAAATADTSSSGAAPPLYATQLPPPARLRYALRYNGQAGEALLVWQHDGQRYRLTLDGTGATGQVLVAQASSGLIDGNGLAPQRFVDRRRSGRQQAANFEPALGQIGFSGPAVVHPAWPGAQDRLSALVQLAAVLAAVPGLAEVRLFVVDARGAGALWPLLRLGSEPGPTPWGTAALQLWQRDPLRPEGLRVQMWLASQADGPAGPWPLRVRYTALRSGDVFELSLLAPPEPAP